MVGAATSGKTEWGEFGQRVGAARAGRVVCGQGSAAVRLARSCVVGGRVWQVVCWGGGRVYTLAGSSSRNLRVARRAPPRHLGRGSGLGAIGSVMRLTVTPLGASGRSASGVAGAVVDYLEGEAGDRGRVAVGRIDSKHRCVLRGLDRGAGPVARSGCGVPRP